MANQTPVNSHVACQTIWHYPNLAPAGAGHSNSCPISSSIAAYSVKTQFSSIIIIVYTVVACIDRSLGAYI